MPVSKVEARLASALADGKVEAAEASAVLNEAHGRLTDEDVAVLVNSLGQHRDAFTDDAVALLLRADSRLGLANLPRSPRDSVVGPQRGEGRATFDALALCTGRGRLADADRLLLAESVARGEVMGLSGAVHAAERYVALPEPERRAFDATLAAAASPLERAFLFKALGAGYAAPEVSEFAQKIHGWPEAKLLETLNLADPNADGKETGLKQQFEASCAATTAQALRGELDPIYALKVRTQNKDINSFDPTDPLKLNPALATEQKTRLETAGGVATPRGTAGAGTPWDALDTMYNAESAHTGLVFKNVQLDKVQPPQTVAQALDAIAGQLDKGIPTPLLVGSTWAPKCHALIALEVDGAGPTQRFLIHDPWVGNTTWVTREQFLDGTAQLGNCHVLGGYHLASPAPAAGAAVTQSPAPRVPSPTPVAPA